MKASMYLYPWDVIDDGMDTCLDTLAGLGINQVSVIVNYHTAKLVLPHNPKRRVYFSEPGLVYFDPDLTRYNGILKPAETTLTRGTSFFSDLTEKAPTYGIDVIAWVIAMHNTALGRANPETTVLTALGDRLIHSFCPVNPESGMFVRGLVDDVVSRFPVKAVELESASFMGFLHGFHHEIAGIEIKPSLDFLLSLCFCPHCMAGMADAGLDSEALRSAVASLIQLEMENSFLPAGPRNLGEFIQNFDQFLEWRIDAVTRLVDSIKRESCPDRELIVIATVFPPNGDARIVNGADPVKLRNVCDTIAVSGYFSNPDDLAGDIDDLAETGLDYSRCRAGLRPQLPDCDNYDNFSKKLSLLNERGFGAVAMYNYGTMRSSSFDWIKTGLESIRNS